MARRPGGPPPLSAPGLIGPTSLPQMVGGRPGTRRRHVRSSGRHLHLLVDLIPASERTSSIPLVREIEAALGESRVVEAGGLVTLATALLTACAAAGYRRVVHWELRPGGWLAIHHLAPGPPAVAVQGLLEALRLQDPETLHRARGFAARLRGPRGLSLDLLLVPVHRERTPALTIDLVGAFGRDEIHALIGTLGRHLPIRRTSATVRAIDGPSR